MTSVVFMFGLVAFAFLIYWSWRIIERGRSTEAAHIAEDVAALGDVVPGSLHPVIDPNRCVGSGACVRACPEHDVLGIVDGRAQLINPLGCVGHGACAAACPFEAIKLVFGTQTRGVELPRVDPNFQTNQPGVYIAGELGGMGLIRNAVSQGSQAATHIAGSQRRGGADVLDAVVVGAGPAGISATLGLLDAGLRVELLEGEDFGGTILHYPRAKVVMTGALEFPGFRTVKKRTMSKEQLVELWQEIHEEKELPLRTGELVEGLEKNGDGTWSVRSTSGTRRAANVVLALGRRGSPQKLGVPGEDLPKVTYRLIEPDPFRGKHALVVGGGNSAVESAIALADDGQCASVGISYRRDDFARCRAENRMRIGAAIAAGKVRSLLPTNVVRIGQRDVVLRWGDGREETIPNDSVIVQIGGTAPSKLLSSFGIDLVEKRGER